MPDTCNVCGEDGMTPSVEAFEQTGEIMCADCWDAQCERQWDSEPDYDAPSFDEKYRAAWAEHQEAHKR